MRALVETRVLCPSETALALELVSATDLLRLKTLARLQARGLPPEVAWDDLLQEALTRVLTGARRKPAAVAMVAFIAGIMRSLRSEYWHRARARSAAEGARAAPAAQAPQAPVEAPDPERALAAAQALAAIGKLFEDDAVVLGIILGLAEGLAAEEIRLAMGLTRTDYDSARRRLRRRLLQEGLTCGAT